MLLLSLFFVSSTNIFFNAIFDVVVDLRNKKFVQIVLNFKTELDQLTLALLAALKMTRASTFNAPFIFTGRIVLTESRRFTTLTQRRVSRCLNFFYLPLLSYEDPNFSSEDAVVHTFRHRERSWPI